MRHWRSVLFYSLPPLLALIVLTAVEFKTDLSAFIIAGDSAEALLLASEMQSGALSRRYLLSVAAARGQRVEAEFMHRFESRLRNVDGVVDVWSPGRQNAVAQTLPSLYAPHANALYSRNGEPFLNELFTPQGLLARAELLKQALLSPQGGMVKKIALHDPLLLTLHGFESLAGQSSQGDGTQSRYRNLILETAAAGLDAPQQRRIQQRILQTFDTLVAADQPVLQLEMTGVPVFAVATQRLIQGDIVRISILSSLALLALFLWLFRSIVSLLQVFTLLLTVVLSAVLITQWAFGYVHGMTVAIGSTLVGICIDYPIHTIAHARAVADRQCFAVIRRIWPSMLLGGLTTLVGYAALGASGYPGFQQVAVYAGTGIVVALFSTRILLPGLVSGRRRLNVPLVSRWSAFCRRYRPWLTVLLLLAVGISSLGLKSLHWLQDMQELTPELDYLKDNDRRIRARMVSIEPGRFILVSGETLEDALRRSEQVYQQLDRLQAQGVLDDYFGLYPWLLSAQQQRLNRNRLQGLLTEDNRRLWRQALKAQGLSVERLGNLDYPDSETLTVDQVMASPVKRLIDSRIISTEQQTVVLIWLAEHRPEALRRAFADIGYARYFSQRDLLNQLTREYTERAKVLLAAGLVVIVLLLTVRNRSLSRALQTLLPAMLAAFFIIGLWSFSGAAISFLHLVGLLLVVSICVDYGIFYQENRGGDLGLTYQAMAASMLTSALAFASLSMAESTSLRILAGVVALGVLLGFLLCPLLIRHRAG